ncbi:thiamine pyrophosphate-binding protein [Bradyrhizobium viridifuturi]|jgi:acetolactate synthase I/II/III large subunit|uniref:thiamine pyrophosphate-binding protein n=2 Tax=Nitrobacteraceae TaxID=41294 RepID=UPI000395ED5E|nr:MULTISPECIES: thiamine pyrophosphate-binding protein [Bradyrhizobium]ERF79926.1 MAG: acetolactate synthase I/II/III large subunit [Bradyrhizobium sp. DFCI-1]OYU61326.1 MAG: thiamine pyrophosphate-binding protein [Bradyrhizobium sp. PARBB1]PSO19724.1 thiamine pyrophosphate-binding protein [Bradyrhizobium sp. MOS004]QRI72236.1 thiamine pyrophosphate-binding protein [Bradyrhizobium sp. PSBB068]MBR1019183.1 thiamine pyrophosphate-binding protein [Bradyrhizobium viridifuturi]
MTRSNARTGGQILIDQLVAQGVERVTCVPGESYLAALDALHDSAIDVMICRAEGGAAMMAEAYGKLTGRPGICFVTRGPGSTNAAHGVHIAMQDSTPMILFVGQVDTGMREREAFQELDYKAVFGTMAKWAVEIDRPDRIPELVARAFRVALQGRPGPVVISLPENMLTETAAVADAPKVVPAATWPAPADLERLGALLASAKAPIVVLGGSAWTAEAAKGIARFAERFDLPVATSFRRASLIDADHSRYAGDLGIGPSPKLRDRITGADVILLIGGRMSEMPSSSYTLLDIPTPSQQLVHVHPGSEELGRVYQPALAIQATPAAFASAVETMKPSATPAWKGEAAKAHTDYLAWTDKPRELPGNFQYGEVVTWLRDRLPKDAIVCNGAGNYAGWIHRHHRFHSFAAQLAPTSGSMGYGVPAAVMAKRQHPDRVVVAFAGDGCFLMNGQEFATAVQYDAPLIVVVIDNAQYGTIRMHQERDYPGRVVGTQLKNPDFALYAKAFGGHGERVERTEDFAPAFERALASGKPAILHCLVDQRALSVGKDFVPQA